MPIDNRLFGVWKVLSVYSPKYETISPYIVEKATESTEQTIQTKKYIQGTALPRVLDISGGIGNIEVTAPLLVSDTPRAAVTTIPDGLSLWDALFNATMISGSFNADPGFILTKAQLEASAENGVKYSFTMRGDADALYSEWPYGTTWFELADSGDPFSADGVPFRVAQFYDIRAQVGSFPTDTYITQLNVDINFSTEDFAVIRGVDDSDPSNDQRKIIGISGAEIVFSGTVISSNRAPTGNDFGWQDLETYGNQGGVATKIDAGIDLTLRQCGINLMPGVDLSSAVFETTSLDINPSLLKSTFRGRVWFTTQDLTV